MRKQVYRKIWEEARGPIPKGYHIHHVNGDPSDNRLENLLCVSPQEHFDIHYKQGDYKEAKMIALAFKPIDRALISKLQSLINSTYPMSEKTKAKISAKAKINNKGCGNPMFGKNHTEASKKKIAVNRVGKYTGRNSGKWNKTVNTFTHPEHGIEKATLIDMQEKYGLSTAMLSRVSARSRPHHKQWRLVNE